MNADCIVVVNADDFGMSSSVNQAIVRSLETGLISSTTIMSNMPGFDEACQLAHEYRMIDHIGVHLNLTEGRPLTQKIQSLKRCCDASSNFCFRPSHGHRLSRLERAGIYEELNAQVARCVEMGLKPTHLDSHHHCHHYWGVGTIVMEIARSFQIPAVRIAFNWGNRISLKRRVYGMAFNRRLGRARLAKTAYFCDIRDVTPELLQDNRAIEVIVHPRLSDRGEITHYDHGRPLSELVQERLRGQALVSYRSVPLLQRKYR